MALTNYFGNYDYMNADAAIDNGGDTMLFTLGKFGATVTNEDKATVQNNMRRASKNILYTVVNSNAMYSEDKKKEILSEVGVEISKVNILYRIGNRMGIEGWKLRIYILDFFIILLMLLWLLKTIKMYRNQDV